MANRYMPFKWSDSPAINLTLRRGALPKPVRHAMMAKLTEVLMWWEKVPDTPAARKISAGAWQNRRALGRDPADPRDVRQPQHDVLRSRTMSEANKIAVVAFYKQALMEGAVENAFQRYAGPTYRQHNPLIEDGMDGVRKFVAWIVASHPDARGEMLQHGVLIDRAFIGDLADVERGRLVKQDHPADTGGAAGAVFHMCVQEALKLLSHPLVMEHVDRGSIHRELRNEASASIEVGKDERRDLIAIGPGQHDVAHERSEFLDESHTQPVHIDPRAARQLEFLRNPSFVQQAPAGVGRIIEPERIAQPVEAFFVERVAGERGAAPVAGRDAGAAQPGFELAVHRHQLDLHPGRRQTDIVRPVGVPGAAERIGRGFGRAQSGQEQNAFTASVRGELLHFVENVLSNSGSGVPKYLEAAEEVPPQLGIGPQVRQQRFEALGHVEIPVRRDFPQVAHG